jgi:hypothetical protein
MKNTQKTIFFIVIIVLVLGTIATFIIRGSGPSVGSKYDGLATCLKDKGANFYGAFWCPHCQAQKKEFGSSSKLLPYVECSTADANGQLQVCIDKKIESYPTWTFANPINIVEKTAPIVCTKTPGIPGEDPTCEKPGVRSEYAKAWLFPEYQIYAVEEPVHTGDQWTFVAGTQIRGDVSLEDLAKQSSCTLPTADATATTTPVAK